MFDVPSHQVTGCSCQLWFFRRWIVPSARHASLNSQMGNSRTPTFSDWDISAAIKGHKLTENNNSNRQIYTRYPIIRSTWLFLVSCH